MSMYFDSFSENDSISNSCYSYKLNLPQSIDGECIEDISNQIIPSWNDSLRPRSTAYTEHRDICNHNEIDSNVYEPDFLKEYDAVITNNSYVYDHKISGDTENDSNLSSDEKKDIFIVEIEKEEIFNQKTTKNKNRKNSRDGITKKLLTHVWQYIKDEFNGYLTKNKEKLGFPEADFPKKIKNLANKDFKSKVKIEAIKQFQNKKIIYIYSKKWGEPLNEKDSNYEDNLKIISRLKNKKDEISHEFKAFLTKTFLDHFQDYLNSKQYLRDKIKIRKKQSEDYMKWFEIYVEGNSELEELGFREYYKQTPGNKTNTKQKHQL